MRGNTQPYAEQMQRQRTFLSGEEIVMILTDEVKQMLSSAGFLCTVEKEIPHGKQLRLAQGTVVNIFNTGKITVQGKSSDDVEKALHLSRN